MKILLVEPNFPIPAKSKNHKNFLPLGLLKIASYLKEKKKYKIKLIRGTVLESRELAKLKKFQPDEIWITSLFTYWAEHVKNAVKHYRDIFPNAKIIVGGIYASLMPQHCKEFTGCDEVFIGVIKESENSFPAYYLIKNANPGPLDYQIIHTSRGCDRRCQFCGTWKIEPEFLAKNSITHEVRYRKIVFYDNNFLSNPFIENILKELVDLKKERKILWCESQSGFDGRILLKKPYLAKLLKDSGFRSPRIAWDWEFNQYPFIKKQIEILEKVGFRSKDLYVFMLYNWKIPFEEMEKKRKKCWNWKVQIADCRFRPLNQTYDFYDHGKKQSDNDYFIHPDWTDEKVKIFRRNVRRQNICVRQNLLFYSRELEKKRFNKEETSKLKRLRREEIKKYLNSVWYPN